MSSTRRQFIAASAAACAVSSVQAEPPAKSDAKLPQFKLGTVTYNVAAQWDLPTLLKICKTVGIAAVECRTTHKHGVEPTLTAEQRVEVKKRFADSGVIFWGCGSVCEFHAPEKDVVKKNIETCKQFIELVHDIGGTGVKVRPNGLPKGVEVEDSGADRQVASNAATRLTASASNLGRGPRGRDAGAANIKTIMTTRPQGVGLTWNSTRPTSGTARAVRLPPARRGLLVPYQRPLQDHTGLSYRELFRLFQKAATTDTPCASG